MAIISKTFDPNKNTVVAFDHIHKCAGSSIRLIIHNSPYPSYPIPTVSSLLQACDKLNATPHKGITFIAGHDTYGVHRLLSDDYQVCYFTFLRDPVALCKSVYTYGKTKCDYLYGSFDDFVYHFDFNIMTNHLGGSLESAKDRLSKYFMIGFVDNFSDSIAQLETHLRVSLNPNVKANRSNPKFIAPGLKIEAHGPDCQLYDYFKNNATAPAIPSQGERITVPTFTDNKFRKTCLTGEMHKLKQGAEQFYKGSRSHSAILSKAFKIQLEDDVFYKILRDEKDRLTSAVDPLDVNTKEKFLAVEKLTKRIGEQAEPDQNNILAIRYQDLMLFLGSTRYAHESGLSEQYFTAAYNFHPENTQAVLRYAAWLRLKGQGEKAVHILDNIPPDKRSKRYYQEYLTTLGVTSGDAGICKFLSENNHEIRTLFPPIEASADHYLLNRMAGKNLLVVRSGPQWIFEDLVNTLTNYPVNATLLVQKGYPIAVLPKKYPVEYLNDGFFQPEQDFPGRQRLRESSFDHIIYACSDFPSLNRLTNFLVFFRDVKHLSDFAYPLPNTFMNRKNKYLILLE